MFRSRTMTRTNESISNEIIFSIVTNNINNVKKLIHSKNYNDILDDNTGFTPLQYAIASPNVDNEIIKYLIQLGANPKHKIGIQNIDSFDLAIRYNKKYLFEYFNKIQEDKIEVLTDKIDLLKGKISNLEDTNHYLCNSIDTFNDKIFKLNNEIKQKDIQINNLKRKNDDTELAFNNLLKKVKK